MEVFTWETFYEMLAKDDLHGFQIICADESKSWNDKNKAESWFESMTGRRIIALSAEFCAPKCLDWILLQYHTINPNGSGLEKSLGIRSLFVNGKNCPERMISCINLLVRKYGADINSGGDHDSLASQLIIHFRRYRTRSCFEIAKCILMHGASIPDILFYPTSNEPFARLIESRRVCQKKMTILIGVLKKRRIKERNIYVRSSLRDLAPLIAYMGWQSRFDI